MRVSYFFFLTLLLISFSTARVQAEVNAFVSNLSLGSSGPEVLALQKILNQDPTTRVASTGSGSPGNETGYFGALTKAAVIRFQQKYANKILTPTGLSQGNGRVGSYTRAMLNAVSVMAINKGGTTVTPPTTALAPKVSPSISPTAGAQNPNLKNIEPYLDAIKRVGLKQGLSVDTLSSIENKIRAEAATTTDFTQQFFDLQKASYEKRISEETSHSPVLAFFKKALSLVAEPFVIQKAYAAIGLPLGGYITYVNPAICNCPPGVITHLFIALPNVPTVSNLLLTYVNGSEAFSYYNIPEPSIAVLGTYIPGVPACWTYVGISCVLVPSEGMIINPTGSSLAP